MKHFLFDFWLNYPFNLKYEKCSLLFRLELQGPNKVPALPSTLAKYQRTPKRE